MKNESRSLKNTVGISMSAVALMIFVAGCGREEIQVYSVPKEKPSSPMVAAIQAGAPGRGEAPLTWKTPTGWKELSPTAIRIGNFSIEGKDGSKADLAITSFPGSVGSELDNWNRWRGEIGLPPTAAAEVVGEPVKVGAENAMLYDMTGAQLRTVVASLPRNGATWFFKMRGDKELVAAEKNRFIDFLKTIEFNTDTVPQTEVLGSSRDNPHASATRDPHEGLAAPHPLADFSATADSKDPKFSVPSHWKETAPPPMVLKHFSIADGQAKLAISSLGGDGGGLLPNVNRWRNQLGLEPITAQELPKHITSFDVGGTKATLVDLAGADYNTGKPSRMITAVVPRGKATWFYKMTGDDAVVAREKDALVKFIQSARFE